MVVKPPWGGRFAVPPSTTLWGNCLQFTENTEGGYGEQVEDQGERSRAQRDRDTGHAAPVCPAQRAPSARPQVRLWPGAVWRLFGAPGREGDPELCYSGG